jgi:cytidine deaminase
MTRKFIFTLVLISAGFLAICGCSKAASSTPYVNGSDIIRQKLGTAIDGYPESVQSVLREIVLQEGFVGVITKEQAQTVATKLSASPQETALALVNLASIYAKTPISNYNVGAVAIGSSGNMYFGCNLEFSGQPLSFSVHAEQSAIMNAWMHGETGVTTLAITAAPCGYCRQFLNELSTASTLEILLEDSPPISLLTLLPKPFGPADLGMTGALMLEGKQSLNLSAAANDRTITAALAAASSSYAPYSLNYAGVALESTDGVVVTGRYAENAAYNPSMSPLQAALSQYNLTGRDFSEIKRAVLVQTNLKTTNQSDVTKAALGSVARQATLEIYLATHR